jgi:TolA-binding protein
MVQSRAFEVEIEQMEDQMENLPDTEIRKKQRLENQIAALNEKIKAMKELLNQN